ncbi:hypothetical protein L7F22_067007 [Adiantum nelumboides]|nr:hypothetical protein [Adiantum nelumboides]
MEKGVENPYQELKQLLEGKPSSKKKDHAQHERSPSREREESESSDESMEDVAPRRRRARRSPTPTKQKRSPHSPHRRESKREENNSKKKKERKRSPSSPTSSPSSSSDEDDIPRELPPKRGDDDHMIELIPGSSPPNKPPYRVSQAQQEEIMRQVNELVEKGMVRPSSSPFCSPVLLVQKKDGTYRMCVDYRALNRITIKNRFPVPRVEDLFDKLQGSTYFSRIDLKSGYHQIRIVDEDIVKTAFRTTFGLYEYLAMPFGLTNAPATFNRMMERIFRPHRNFIGVFFDNVIIYSKTIEEHKEHLKNGIHMDPAKLEVIKDWPNPRNLHEVRTPFILRTDHQSLKYFMTQTKLSDKQMRWANFLSRFNFHIAHIAGKHNQVADALSRWPKVNAVSIATHNDLSLMIDEYAIDPDFKDVISAIALGKKEEPFTLQDGYLLHGNRLCITHSLREKVMFESHAPPYAGHRGIQTTMKAIETYFYWPTMKGDIQDYVSKCVVCQKMKYDRGKQPGLLQPLPILDSPWESISMDFIFGLPKSIHGNTGIWRIVDKFSRPAHLIPIKKTIKAHQMATLFISQVFKYHGLPTSIVSDRDPRMTSNFWKGLFDNLGTRLNFSSAYHSQTDGQSEIANLTVLDLLKAYVTEVDQRSQWEKYLPLVEYAYNNTVHTSIGKAPFEVIEGRPKSPLLLKVHGKIFVADEYSRDLKESFQKIKEAISIAQQKQKVAANKHRRALAFKENDWVLLKFPT